jgi:hypothetical protein
MQTILTDHLKNTALTLVDDRIGRVEALSQDASLSFFEGGQSRELWAFSTEALGELAVLRHRISSGAPLNQAQVRTISNLLESPPVGLDVSELKAYSLRRDDRQND